MKCDFTYEHYKHILKSALDNNYKVLNCVEYIDARNDNRLGEKTLVLRHDVDSKAIRAMHFARIEHELGVHSTYFFRVFSNEYNIFAYDTMAMIRDIKKMGHEIGYHAEPVDVSASCGISPKEAFMIGKSALELVIQDKVIGAASHREATGYNNLKEYIESCELREMDIEYEGYDNTALKLFNNSYYITDGYEWYWRSFEKGEKTGNTQCACEVIKRNIPLIYCLTHPNSWYEKHYHRVEY